MYNTAKDIKESIKEIERLLGYGFGRITQDKDDESLYTGKFNLFGNIFKVSIYTRKYNQEEIDSIYFESDAECNEFGVNYVVGITDNVTCGWVNKDIELAMSSILKVRALLFDVMDNGKAFMEWLNEKGATLAAYGTVPNDGPSSLDFISMSFDNIPIELVGTSNKEEIGLVYYLYNTELEEQIDDDWYTLPGAIRHLTFEMVI